MKSEDTVKWSKSETKGQIICDKIYLRHLNKSDSERQKEES